MAKKDQTKIVSLIGKNVFIRTVTHYYTGKLVSITKEELALQDAAWIADTGRFSNALKTNSLSEIEPFEDGVIFVNRGAMIDISEWKHALPREVK
ncbi:MAG: hypothetical protein LUQ69_10670 [Methanoregulaceae archaeon]|jgi:hypothetical protein|nr:hypothetical protein [Methanoregulaceae archaeon]